MDKYEIAEKINRRRRQLIIHSYIYYVLDNNIITDAEYDRFARELKELQTRYPEIAKECAYHKEFEDFAEAGSGYKLPRDEEWIIRTANDLVEYCRRKST